MATYAEPVEEQRHVMTRRRGEMVVSDRLAALVPLGRLLFVAVFFASVPGHFTPAYVAGAAQAGVPAPDILVPLSGVMAGIGAFLVLLGWHARIGALLLIAFLVPVSFAMHNWWDVTDPMMRGIQQAQFMKNLAIIGGALLIGYWGSGPFSLDARRLRGAGVSG